MEVINSIRQLKIKPQEKNGSTIMSELPSAANLSPEDDAVKNGTSTEAWLRPHCLQWIWELFPGTPS